MIILRHWIFLIIIGGGSGAWATIHIICDYPPPDAVRKLGWLIFAGAAGGLVAAALFPNVISESNPMPGQPIIGIAAAAGLGLVASGFAAIAAGFANKQHLK